MKKINLLLAIISCCLFSSSLMAQNKKNTSRCFSNDTETEIVDLSKTVQESKYAPPPPPSPPSPPPTFNRLIYMVHGLGGGENTWAKAAHAIQLGALGFPARKAVALRPTYSEFTLSGAGVDLHNALVGFDNHMAPGMDFNHNFIIGSSQGGLVARACDQYEQTIEPERRFDGIVTFGTPHQGARILNNKQMLLDMIYDGLIAMKIGPTAEGIETSVVLDLFFGCRRCYG